jgi:hypothetical protein
VLSVPVTSSSRGPAMTRAHLAAFACLTLAACGGGGSSTPSGPTDTPSSAKELTGFRFTAARNPKLGGADRIANIQGGDVYVAVPFADPAPDLTGLVATFTTTGQAVTVGGVAQESGVTANDFTGGVTYGITAEDGTSRAYVVHVSMATGPALSLLGFGLAEPGGAVTAGVVAEVDATHGTVEVTWPYHLDDLRLVASFTLEEGASASAGGTLQVSGSTVNDFTTPVIYAVVAPHRATKDYTVTLVNPPSDARALHTIAFKADAGAATPVLATGAVDEARRTVAATVPFGTDLHLVPVFTITGSALRCAGQTLTSGVSVVDFTARSVTCTVVAESGASTDYQVTLDVASSNQTSITSFTLLYQGAPDREVADQRVRISDDAAATGKIDVVVPMSSGNTFRVRYLTTGNPDAVTFNGRVVASGSTTLVAFAGPVTCLVTAPDGVTRRTYTITVREQLGFTSFTFPRERVTGKLTAPGSSSAGTVTATVAGLDPGALVASFATSRPGVVVRVGGVTQASGTTANDFRSPVVYVLTDASVTPPESVSYVVTLTRLSGVWSFVGGTQGPVREVGGVVYSSYGTRGVESRDNLPPGRSDAGSCIDLDGDLWMFGGSGIKRLNDLWRYSPTTGAWTWMSGEKEENVPPFDMDDPTGVFGEYGSVGSGTVATHPGSRVDPAMWVDRSGDLWMFGGIGNSADTTQSINCFLDDLWRYAVASGVWTWMGGSDRCSQFGVYGARGVPAATNWPGGRFAAAAWWRPDEGTAGKLYLLGGMGYDDGAHTYPSYGELNDVWVLDQASLQWTWINGPRNTTYDSSGSNPSASIYGRYPASPSASGSGSYLPGARYGAATWVDAAGNLWLLGGAGYGASFGGYQNQHYVSDVWMSPAAGGSAGLVWAWIDGPKTSDTVTSTDPAPRQSSVWADPESGRYWLYGGYRNQQTGERYSSFFGDLERYQLDPANLVDSQWTFVRDGGANALPVYPEQAGTASTQAWPGGRHGAVKWRDADGNLWMFGGVAFDPSDGFSDSYNDTWRYTP